MKLNQLTTPSGINIELLHNERVLLKQSDLDRVVKQLDLQSYPDPKEKARHKDNQRIFVAYPMDNDEFLFCTYHKDSILVSPF